jgi:hypothetical protein
LSILLGLTSTYPHSSNPSWVLAVTAILPRQRRNEQKKKKTTFPFRKQYSNILAANCTPKASDGGFGGAETHHRERVTGDITGAEEVGPTEQVGESSSLLFVHVRGTPKPGTKEIVVEKPNRRKSRR